MAICICHWVVNINNLALDTLDTTADIGFWALF
jgi:hypothetical protein